MKENAEDKPCSKDGKVKECAKRPYPECKECEECSIDDCIYTEP